MNTREVDMSLRSRTIGELPKSIISRHISKLVADWGYDIQVRNKYCANFVYFRKEYVFRARLDPMKLSNQIAKNLIIDMV